MTNVEADHLDNYGTEEAYRAAFVDVPRPDRPGRLPRRLRRRPGRGRPRRRRPATRGIEVDRRSASPRDADLRADGLDLRRARRSTFTVVAATAAGSARSTLRIPGRHYVLDALAALAAGLRLGFGFEALRGGLESFTGTRRRMELKGEAAGVRVYDSYAHHPNEIAGDLAGRAVARRRRAGSSSPSSRTWSPAPGSSGRRWARRSVRPTRSS